MLSYYIYVEDSSLSALQFYYRHDDWTWDCSINVVEIVLRFLFNLNVHTLMHSHKRGTTWVFELEFASAEENKLQRAGWKDEGSRWVFTAVTGTTGPEGGSVDRNRDRRIKEDGLTCRVPLQGPEVLDLLLAAKQTNKQTNTNFAGLFLQHNASVYPKDVTVFGSGLSHLLTYKFYLQRSPPEPFKQLHVKPLKTATKEALRPLSSWVNTMQNQSTIWHHLNENVRWGEQQMEPGGG